MNDQGKKKSELIAELKKLREYVADLESMGNERKKAEEAQRESNAYLENLINFANAPIIVWDAQFRITRFNHAFEFLTGRNEADIIGQPLELLFPPPLIEASMALIRKTLTGERWETVEIAILHIDGTIKTVLWNSATLFSPDGQTPVATIAQGQDITERKQAEEALRESEHKFRNLVWDMHVGVLLQDAQAKIFLSNPKALELLGISEDQLLGMTSFDPDWNVIHADGSPFSGTEHPVPQAIATRHSVLNSIMGVYRPTSADRVWLSVDAEPQLNADGTIRQVVCTFIDISDLTHAENSLREANAFLENLLNYANAPIIVWDAQFRITRFNHAFEFLTGRNESDVIGQPLELLFPPPLIETSMALIRKTLTGERWETVEIAILHENGSIRTVLWNSATLFSPDDHSPVVTIAQGQDITERKQAEEALRESNAYLENLINFANAPIIVWDAQFRITRFNHAFEFLTGRNEADVIGQPLELLFPPPLIETSMALIRKTLTGERWETLEIAIMHIDGSIRTVLWNSATLFSSDGKTPVATIAQGQDITERKKLEKDLQLQATTDTLTGIVNRRHLLDLAQKELQRAIRHKRPLTVALIDIDHFKQINDTFGHAVGDQVLLAFTKICQKNIREVDVFARYGGDEFALLLPEAGYEQAYEVVERIRLSVASRPISIDGYMLSITISSGIARLSSDQEESINTMLSQADHALYRAKEEGRNQSVVYNV